VIYWFYPAIGFLLPVRFIALKFAALIIIRESAFIHPDTVEVSYTSRHYVPLCYNKERIFRRLRGLSR
jgi:hypothetical protein